MAVPDDGLLDKVSDLRECAVLCDVHSLQSGWSRAGLVLATVGVLLAGDGVALAVVVIVRVFLACIIVVMIHVGVGLAGPVTVHQSVEQVHHRQAVFAAIKTETDLLQPACSQ